MSHYALLREAGKNQFIYFKEVDPVDNLLRYTTEPINYMTFKSFKAADKYKRFLLKEHMQLHFSDLEVKKIKKKQIVPELNTWQHFQAY